MSEEEKTKVLELVALMVPGLKKDVVRRVVISKDGTYKPFLGEIKERVKDLTGHDIDIREPEKR